MVKAKRTGCLAGRCELLKYTSGTADACFTCTTAIKKNSAGQVLGKAAN